MTQSFGHNPAGQITTRGLSNDSFAFTNRVNVNRSYAANGLNQYSSAGLANFAYDANGNLTSDGSVTYSYDTENRLVGASGASQRAVRSIHVFKAQPAANYCESTDAPA